MFKKTNFNKTLWKLAVYGINNNNNRWNIEISLCVCIWVWILFFFLFLFIFCYCYIAFEKVQRRIWEYSFEHKKRPFHLFTRELKLRHEALRYMEKTSFANIMEDITNYNKHMDGMNGFSWNYDFEAFIFSWYTHKCTHCIYIDE